MEFREVSARRRMVRNYTSDPVDPAAVERVVEAARRGPSAGFTQGQYFVVVTEDEPRRALAEVAHEEDHVAKGLDPWISSAPVLIAVCTSEADYKKRYEESDKSTTGGQPDWPVPYWWVDAGAALMLLLLAAVDEGLAAGFFGVHRLEGLSAALGVPPEVTPIGVVTLGYPAPDRRSRSLNRGWKPLGEVVHHQRWGTPFPQP